MSYNSLWFLILSLSVPVACFGNALIPVSAGLVDSGYDFITYVAIFLAIVVFVEALLLKKILRAKFWRFIFTSLIMNTASAVCGYVLMRIFLMWIFDPLSKISLPLMQFRMQSYGLLIILAVISFFLSVAVEYSIIGSFFKGTDKKVLAKGVWWANGISYILLIALTSIFYWLNYYVL